MYCKKNWFCLIVLIGFLTVSSLQNAFAADKVEKIFTKKFFVGGDQSRSYFLLGSTERTRTPRKGYRLLIVLPGNDAPDLNSFVKKVYETALSNRYLLAQFVPFEKSPDGQIQWPTKSTVEFVNSVIKDIKLKHQIHDNNIFTFAWDSAGPAAYAVSAQKERVVTASYIAMAPFEPNIINKNISRQAYVIDHSPDDKVYPFSTVQKARTVLRQNGGVVKTTEYKGGHIWPSNKYERIAAGIKWLQTNHAIPSTRLSGNMRKELSQLMQKNDPALEVVPGIGVGPIRLGMSKKEVIKLLGTPDKIEGRGMGLSYQRSKGLSIIAPDQTGVEVIDCWSKFYGFMYLKQGTIDHFIGQTKDGIKMGVSVEKIISIYGEPDRKMGNGPYITMCYEKLRTRFMLRHNTLININIRAAVP